VKKLGFPILLVIVVLLFSGCTKKTASSTTPTVATVPDAVQSVQTVSDTSSTDTAATAPTTNTNQATATDTTALEQTFSQNYTEALQTANASLQNKAKFCAAQIEYMPSTSSNSKQSFFFTADISGIKDYYWTVIIDPYSTISKKRVLAARKDYSDDIICMQTPAATPPSYVSALTTLQNSGATLPTAEDVAKTVISLKDSAWNVVIWGKTGQALLAQQIPISTTTSTSTSQGSAL